MKKIFLLISASLVLSNSVLFAAGKKDTGKFVHPYRPAFFVGDKVTVTGGIFSKSDGTI